jgi:hypothetical protein
VANLPEVQKNHFDRVVEALESIVEGLNILIDMSAKRAVKDNVMSESEYKELFNE